MTIARQVYRYIRLTYLMNDLLNAVDRDVIGLQVGVELSYLTVSRTGRWWRKCMRVPENIQVWNRQKKNKATSKEEKNATKEIVRLWL